MPTKQLHTTPNYDNFNATDVKVLQRRHNFVSPLQKLKKAKGRLLSIGMTVVTAIISFILLVLIIKTTKEGSNELIAYNELSNQYDSLQVEAKFLDQKLENEVKALQEIKQKLTEVEGEISRKKEEYKAMGRENDELIRQITANEIKEKEIKEQMKALETKHVIADRYKDIYFPLDRRHSSLNPMLPLSPFPFSRLRNYIGW